MNRYIKWILLIYIIASLYLIICLTTNLNKEKISNKHIEIQGSYVYISNDKISINIDTIKEEVELIDQINRTNYVSGYKKINENIIKVEIPNQYDIIICCSKNQADIIVINDKKEITAYECEKKSNYLVSFEY